MKIRILIEFEQFSFNSLYTFSTCFMLAEFFEFLLHHFVCQIVISVVSTWQAVHREQLIQQELFVCDVLHIGLVVFHHLTCNFVCQVFACLTIKYTVEVEVVQTPEFICQIFRLLTEHFRFLEHDVNRNVAQANASLPSALSDYCFSDHTRWVCEVDEPCIRAQFLHIFNNCLDDWSSSQKLEHSASAICFLTKLAMA